MRDHFIDIIGEDLATLNLYEINAMGPRLSVYQYTTETNALFPHSIVRDALFYFGRGRQRDV